jgi:site-specific recombinase XerD
VVISTEAPEAATVEWAALLSLRSAETARSYRGAAERFLRSCGKEPRNLAAADFTSYCASLGRRGLAASTIAHHITAVRSFILHCQLTGRTSSFDVDCVRRPLVPPGGAERALTDAELATLLRAAADLSSSSHLAVSVLALMGMRARELATAEWRDLFEDQDGRVGIRVLGKGSKVRKLLVRGDLWSLVRTDREARGLGVVVDPLDRTPLLRKKDGSPYSTAGIWKLVRVAGKRAQLKRAISPHWLRHTYGSLAARAGASVFQIQRDLGHADINTSQRYVSWDPGLAGSAALLLPPVQTA